MNDAWTTYRRSGDVPVRLVGHTGQALKSLSGAVAGGNRAAVRQAALNAKQAALDLELQYRPASDVDRGRFDAWLQQLLLDGQAKDAGAVLGDVATLEWIRDRFEADLGGRQDSARHAVDRPPRKRSRRGLRGCLPDGCGSTRTR